MRVALSPAAAGMPQVLVLMPSLLQVCVGGRSQAQGPAQALLPMGFAEFILKTVSDWEMQLFRVLQAQEAPQSRACALAGAAGGRVGWLGCSNPSTRPAPPDCHTIPVLAGLGLKKTATIFGHRWIWNAVTFWVI